MEPELKVFAQMDAADDDWHAFGTLERLHEQEVSTGRGPTPDGAHRLRLTHLPSVVSGWFWGLWLGERLIGTSRCFVEHTQYNQHAIRGHVYVHPHFRQMGYGRRLLAPILAHGQHLGRTLLVGACPVSVEAGCLGAEAFGARVGMHIVISRAAVEQVDSELMRDWSNGSNLGSQFEAEFYDGPVPDHLFSPFMDLKLAMNGAPREALEIEDVQRDDDFYRQVEAHYASLGRVGHGLVIRDKASQLLVGSTHVWWDPHTPKGLNQGDTVVLSAFRGRGLGRWLKGAMFERIRALRPEVVWIETGNAGSNEPMLAINHAMGFEPFDTVQVWQLDVPSG